MCLEPRSLTGQQPQTDRLFRTTLPIIHIVALDLAFRLEKLHTQLPDSLRRVCEWYLPDFYYRHLRVPQVIRRWIQNRHVNYTVHSLDDLRRKRTSDTLFLLGCGRSITDVSEETWRKLTYFDTFAWNYFIYHRFVPTYYALTCGRNPAVHKYHIEIVRKRADDYAPVTMIISSRERRRGMHPRLIPEYFPADPSVAYFLYPKVMHCPADRPFAQEHFRETMYYRGGINLYLHFARLLGYKKIVLVGCDMNSAIPFYEDYPKAQWMKTLPGYLRPRAERERSLYKGSYQSKGKHSFVETILAINQFVFQPEGIELYVLGKQSRLFPSLPLYSF